MKVRTFYISYLTKTQKDSIMYLYELVRMPDASYRKSLNTLLRLFRAL
nr:MAG TPA: hypothetical protein [Caudoviricetes sp.]